MVLAISYISILWLYEWFRTAHKGFRVSTSHQLREWFLATREYRTDSSIIFPF